MIDERWYLLLAFISSIAMLSSIVMMKWLDRLLTKMDEAYKTLDRQIDLMRARGIYMIWCDKEEAGYIGSTEVNFHMRWGQHIALLDRGEHDNPRLQAAWDTHGRDAFYFFVVEPIENADEIKARELWMLEWRAANIPAKANYNVNNTRARKVAPTPELQFVYPTRIVRQSAPQKKTNRKPALFKKAVNQ